MVAYERPRRDIGFHFVDQIEREAKSQRLLPGGLAVAPAALRLYALDCWGKAHLSLQRAVEEALQEGLWRYERNAGRAAICRPMS
jgi:hypothetical protein